MCFVSRQIHVGCTHQKLMTLYGGKILFLDYAIPIFRTESTIKGDETNTIHSPPPQWLVPTLSAWV